MRVFPFTVRARDHLDGPAAPITLKAQLLQHQTHSQSSLSLSLPGNQSLYPHFKDAKPHTTSPPPPPPPLASVSLVCSALAELHVPMMAGDPQAEFQARF